MAAWASNNASKEWAEQFYLYYSIYWIGIIAIIVAFQLFEQFDGLAYFCVGLFLALPIYILPPLLHKEPLPFQDQYWFKSAVWLAVFSFIGNHFLTHYFFNVLGCWYTVPTANGLFELNGVPYVMHLLTVPYFATYHTLMTRLFRWGNFWHSSTSVLKRVAVVALLGYTTAFVEAFSISAFPHYRYPDATVMYVQGSAFYTLLFLVTYPAYSLLDELPTTRRTLLGFVEHALACGMAVFILDDAWRLCIGAVAANPGEAEQGTPYA